MGFKKTVSAKNDAFSYEVIEECGTIATNGNWEMKLRYIKWGNNPPKYDLRYWRIKEDGTEVNGLSIIGEIQDDKFYIVKDENDEIIESSIVGVVAYDSFGQFV